MSPVFKARLIRPIKLGSQVIKVLAEIDTAVSADKQLGWFLRVVVFDLWVVEHWNKTMGLEIFNGQREDTTSASEWYSNDTRTLFGFQPC